MLLQFIILHLLQIDVLIGFKDFIYSLKLKLQQPLIQFSVSLTEVCRHSKPIFIEQILYDL